MNSYTDKLYSNYQRIKFFYGTGYNNTNEYLCGVCGVYGSLTEKSPLTLSVKDSWKAEINRHY
jgi:outer membrane protein assembly factor BamA